MMITPTEELEIRSFGNEVWARTWANAPDLQPKQAFQEGHYIAFASGIMAVKKSRMTHEAIIGRLYRVALVSLALNVALLITLVVVVLR